VDDKRIEDIFEIIEESNVDLDYDPIQRGPKFLNNMVAETRNMTNTIQKFEREVSREQLKYERQLGKLEAEYEIPLLYEIHAGKFFAGRGRPSINPEHPVNTDRRLRRAIGTSDGSDTHF
jgi:hypothetical protein